MRRCWGNRESNRNSPELEIPLTPAPSATYIFLIATKSRIIVRSGHFSLATGGLIYGSGIKKPRKSLKTKDRDHA